MINRLSALWLALAGIILALTTVAATYSSPASVSLAAPVAARTASALTAGATTSFAVVLSSNRTATHYRVEFVVRDHNGTAVWEAWRGNITLFNGSTRSVTVTWPVARKQAAGLYTLAIGLFDSSGSRILWDGTFATLTIVR